MNFPKLQDHAEVKAAADRLRELRTEEAQLEATIVAYRDDKVQAASLEERAVKLAEGIEIPVAEPNERALETAKARLDLVQAAVRVQSLKLAEVRERVGTELSESIRPQYEPIVNDIARCVKALSAAIQKHHDFAHAMTAAGLPWIGAVPLGGHYKRPRLLVDFGSETDEHCYAREWFEILNEFYPAERKESRRATAAVS